MAEKEITLGQASRLMGISQKELEDCIENLKKKLKRSKITYVELGSATGLSQQQIYRCRGELYRKFEIEIIGEREKAGAIAEAERIEYDRAKVEELTNQLDKMREEKESAERALTKINEETAQYRREQKELEKSEPDTLGAPKDEEKRKRWDKLSELIGAVFRKYDIDNVEKTIEKAEEIERKIKEIKERLASST